MSEILGARLDVLVHHLAYNQMESTPQRLVDEAKALLMDPDFRKVTGTQKAFYHMIIGLSWFISEKVPYEDVKTQFKVGIREAEGDNQILAALLHNLAVVNYCQITEHNDRLLNGENAE
jgi:hypothetical protein